MGASKEGVMSVRDKIDLVLHTFFLEEEDEEPPDTNEATASTSASSTDNVPTRTGVTPPGIIISGDVRTGTASSAVSSKESLACSGSSSGGGNCSSDLISKKLFLNELSWGGNVSSQQLVNSDIKGRTSSESGGGGGGENNVIIMESSIEASEGHLNINHQKEKDKLSGDKKSEIQACIGLEEDKDNNLVILKDLLENQLRLVRSLEKRLNKSESKFEKEFMEREKLLKTLEDERRQHAQYQMETEATIKSKDERIQELEKQLAIVSAKKPTEDKTTCVTPPPPPPPTPPPQRANFSNMRRPENDLEAPPPYKRAKLDLGQYDTSKHFLPPPPYQKSFQSSPSPSSFQSPRTPQNYRNHPHHQRQSDSPPHLSPAVTPKSAHQNTSGRPRDIRSYLGQEVNDADGLLGGPPDEFQDELERINRKSSSHNQVKIRSNHLSHPPPPYSHHHHAQPSSSSSSLPTSSSSGFVRPSPSTKPRHTRFMFPEGKRRFMNANNSNATPFFQQVNKSKFSQNQFYSDGSLPKSNHHPHSILATNSKHTANRNRFLNLSRPLAKKAPVVIVPLPNSQNTPSSSHFRSLDAPTSAPSRQQRGDEEQAALVPSITPPVIQKKRKVGRPPGSGMKSKLVPRSSFSSTFSSPSSIGGTPLQSGGGPQLPNGCINIPEQTPAAPPPPQRFSQRGRLLKPNRARYSPDPDVSPVVTPRELHRELPREKYLTTKKGYFVGEPFIQQGYPGEEETDHLHREESVGPQLAPSTPAVESEGSGEATCLPTPTENLMMSKSPLESFEDGGEPGVGSSLLFVEVPKWRVIDSEPEDGDSPEDDMTDEAFHRRHHKLEAKEKQRKRWDSQRMREESYLERLKRKQEERERQKELRRQQRKRNKGIKGACEEETITPTSDEIKAIHMGTELPVGAFGHPLPLVEKVDFVLPWEIIASVISKKTASTSSPAPPIVVINEENEGGAAGATGESEKSANSTSAPEIEPMESSSCVAPSSTPVRSSPSSSSISLPSIPSPERSPPPPVIYPEGSGDEVDSQASTVPESLDEDDDEIMIIDEDGEMNGVRSFQEDENNLEEEEEDCGPDSPVFSVDLVDYVNSDQSGGGSCEGPTENFDGGDNGGENCDISTPVSATPSISIPLQKSPSHSKSECPSLDSLNDSSTTDDPSSGTTLIKDLRPKNNNSTVVHFPMSFSTSGTSSSTSTISPHTSSSSSQVSKTSITFFIPNNPLAPSRNLRRPTSTPSNKPSSSPIATVASGPSSDSRRDS